MEIGRINEVVVLKCQFDQIFRNLCLCKVYVAVAYQAKQFFNPSTGSPFFLTVFFAILRPPLIGHVPTAL